MTSQGQYGLNKVKASAFRRWPVLSPYRGVQTTRLTGGHDYVTIALFYIIESRTGRSSAISIVD